jgi:hypothetical protein
MVMGIFSEQEQLCLCHPRNSNEKVGRKRGSCINLHTGISEMQTKKDNPNFMSIKIFQCVAELYGMYNKEVKPIRIR